jgi:uncharacterized membrane protein HdeD (DUF308 family)
MTWPRLVLKGLVQGMLCWNAYHYATVHRPDWDCYATDKKQPNGTEGENMTEAFTQVIMYGFYLSLVGVLITLVEMLTKLQKEKGLTVPIGICDTIVGILAIAWLIWATMVRLSKDGKICAGATMNVNESTEPYAYEQGVFLQVVLVLGYIVPPTLFVATNCGCL